MFQNCNFEGINHESALAAYNLALSKFVEFRKSTRHAIKDMDDVQWKEYRKKHTNLRDEVDRSERVWAQLLMSAPAHYATTAA